MLPMFEEYYEMRKELEQYKLDNSTIIEEVDS